MASEPAGNVAGGGHILGATCAILVEHSLEGLNNRRLGDDAREPTVGVEPARLAVGRKDSSLESRTSTAMSGIHLHEQQHMHVQARSRWETSCR